MESKIENKIQGHIVMVMPEAGGTGKSGNAWKKQEFVLETRDNYPKKICFTLWGDKIDQYKLQTGDLVTVSVDIESREYNGRWYTDLKAWRVEKAGEATAAPAGNQFVGGTEPPVFTGPPPGPADDLPF
jgi:hypothetical protein